MQINGVISNVVKAVGNETVISLHLRSSFMHFIVSKLTNMLHIMLHWPAVT